MGIHTAGLWCAFTPSGRYGFVVKRGCLNYCDHRIQVHSSAVRLSDIHGSVVGCFLNSNVVERDELVRQHVDGGDGDRTPEVCDLA